MMTKAPLLIGEPGVGKTAVIEGLAQRIVEVSKFFFLFPFLIVMVIKALKKCLVKFFS